MATCHPSVIVEAMANLLDLCPLRSGLGNWCQGLQQEKMMNGLLKSEVFSQETVPAPSRKNITSN